MNLHPTARHWWETHDNIVSLVHYMADHAYTAADIAYAVEKPWKHDDIYAEMRQAEDADNHHERNQP